jgi:MYXO-CTERM domain-containing protein
MKQWLVRRGALATVPAVALMLAFNACSSETGAPTDRSSVGNGATEPKGVELEPSLNATARVARLSKQFTRLPVQIKEPQLKLPAGIAAPKPRAPQPLQQPSPVLSKGDARAFVQHGARLRAEVEPRLKSGLIKSASVELPLKANGFVRVQPDGASAGIEFATKDAKSEIDVEVADGIATYPGAGPHGSDLVFRVTGDSVEDFVVLGEKPSQPLVDYVVDTSEIAGLRLYDNTLEFLDKGGDPQVRVKPPRVIDADGVVHEAALSVLDCKADVSGEVPWNRPVTPPGSGRCTVRVGWDDKNVIYPAIVDPVWATAGSLANARYRNAAVRLSTGFVLACGGIGDLGIPMTSCEQFNPAGGSGAGTWAASTAMGTARSDFTLLLLSPASSVLALGGNSIYTSELYNGASWTASGGDFSSGYFNPVMPALTSDGAYVVLIDYQGKPYVLPTATNTWTTGTTNPAPQSPYRYSATIAQIPGQATILRVGGYHNSTYLTTAERYRPSTDSWATPGNATSMTVPRADANIAVLDANRIMIYGGYTGATYAQTAEIYSGSGNSWTFTNGTLPQPAYQGNRGVSAAFHSSGKMFSIADYGGPFMYDPVAASSAWSQINTYSQGFYTIGTQGNVVSAGSKVLLVPVQPSSGTSGAQTACRLFDLGEKGATCSATAECQSGLTCVTDPSDGLSVCCDTPCTNACSSCRATRKTSGTGEGTCGPRKATEYVSDTACPPSAQSTCGNVGYSCDGAGACAKWSNTTECAPGSCADTDTQNNARLCNGAGACVALTTSDCASGYKCSDGQCQTQCYNDNDYCASNYYCQTWASPYYTCQPKKSAGASCEFTSECATGYCVDGVCCETDCSGTCMGCSNAATGQASGSCKPIKTGTDPRNDCDDNGVSSCGQNGACNGAGACQNYAPGSVCTAASCASATSRNVADTCNGTGTCTDNGVQNCATGYVCSGGVCQTQCTDDTSCASSYYCDIPTKQCVADKSSGQACPRDAACSGNSNCVDGVCCNSPCTGTCRSCLKNQTGLAADGLCGDILDDTDPSNECAKDVAYPTSCKEPGTCDGQGACRVYAKTGIVCGADACTGATLTKRSCDGAGLCEKPVTSCYPFTCDAGGTACRVACTVDTQAQDCVEGSFCQNGACVGQKLNGSACTDNTQCKSQFCADLHVGALESDPETGAGGEGSGVDEPVDHPGVCCDKACGNPCEACKKSIKGQGSDGTCGFVKDHTDPAGDCPVDGENPCGYNGECNGGGACRKTPGGTACGATRCVGNSVQGQRCDGDGACIDNDGTTACSPYVCRDVSGAEQCTNPCAGDDDCQDGYYCVEKNCKKKLANGASCDSSGICSSGFCVDGVCCDTSCNGQCAACDNAGSEGICSAVKGEPHGNRTKCDHAGEECGGSCDGVNASACKYVANGTECGATTCDNGIAKSSECNGQGECRANKNVECSPYVCGPDDLCLELCEQDADCSQGYACDETTRRCLPSAVAAVCSEDRQTSIGQNGQTPCKPFLCVPASGTCAVSCAFTTDCAPDFVCEAATKTCLPTPPETAVEDESCACRAVGASPSRHGYLALAALGLAFGGLRRRRRLRKLSRPLTAGPSPVRVSRCRP